MPSSKSSAATPSPKCARASPPSARPAWKTSPWTTRRAYGGSRATKDERRKTNDTFVLRLSSFVRPFMNLILYGPPGVGKTTVGRIAAQSLGRDFVDVDQWIESHWGRP